VKTAECENQDDDSAKKKKKKKQRKVNEDHLSAFLQFHPNVIPNSANELLSTTQRIEKTFRTLSRHFSFRNVKDTSLAPQDESTFKNSLDLASTSLVAAAKEDNPQAAPAARPNVPRISVPPADATASPAPLTAPSRLAFVAGSDGRTSVTATETKEAPSMLMSQSSSKGKKTFWGLWASSPNSRS